MQNHYDKMEVNQNEVVKSSCLTSNDIQREQRDHREYVDLVAHTIARQRLHRGVAVALEYFDKLIEVLVEDWLHQFASFGPFAVGAEQQSVAYPRCLKSVHTRFVEELVTAQYDLSAPASTSRLL